MDIESLSTVDEDAGTFVHFKDAANRPMFDADKQPIGAVVSGTFSSYYRAAFRKQRQAATIRARQRQHRDFDDEADVSATLDTVDDGAHELEVACIRAWTFTSNGAPFEITVANWKALLAKQPQWQEQVAKAMQDHERFFAAS